MSKEIWNARLSTYEEFELQFNLGKRSHQATLGKKSGEIVPWPLRKLLQTRWRPRGKLAMGRGTWQCLVKTSTIFPGDCTEYCLCMMEDRKQWANFDGKGQETRRRARMEEDEPFKVSIVLKTDADLWDELWKQCHWTSVQCDLGLGIIFVIQDRQGGGGEAGVVGFGTSTLHKDGEIRSQIRYVSALILMIIFPTLPSIFSSRIHCHSVGLVLRPLSLSSIHNFLFFSFQKRTE